MDPAPQHGDLLPAAFRTVHHHLAELRPLNHPSQPTSNAHHNRRPIKHRLQIYDRILKISQPRHWRLDPAGSGRTRDQDLVSYSRQPDNRHPWLEYSCLEDKILHQCHHLWRLTLPQWSLFKMWHSICVRWFLVKLNPSEQSLCL